MLYLCSRVSPTGPSYPDPEKFAVLGIDISAHNGDINFEKVAADGISFVIIKATEGGTFKDKKFVENLQKARAAGLKVGAYHFFRFDTPGYMQGLNFLNSLRGRKLDLPVAIDIEECANPNTNKNGHSRFVKGRLEGYPLWICSLVDEPTDMEWLFWQATHNGKVDGINHPVDINAFRGNLHDWQELVMPHVEEVELPIH